MAIFTISTDDPLDVDELGKHIKKQCKKPLNGSKKKAAMDNFDDTGVMVLICRHDIPLFFANIDSPDATVVAFYDIGCVTAQIVSKSCMPMAMSGHRKCHIWLLDRHAAAIGHEIHADLGEWIKRWLFHGIEDQGSTARWLVKDSTHSIDRLRKQWSLQKKAQLSIHAPVHLKKQLDMIITLQSDLDTTEKALQATRNSIANDPIVSESLEVLDGLEHTYSQLMTKVDMLYALLNIQDQYPELDDIRFDIV
ncbi:hypothetical protein HD554DRAFT_2206255 [Boletus coccyginus]|nr:hypothetical protein HD554DRAFT_2206255 [Boletus coccyginus]